MIFAFQFDQARAWNLRGDPAAFGDVGITITFAMQNEGGNADGGQNPADVDLRVHA
jgi:hypothetical protein